MTPTEAAAAIVVLAFVAVMIAAWINQDRNEPLDGPGTWGPE